jgi:periplasmic protein TonB
MKQWSGKRMPGALASLCLLVCAGLLPAQDGLLRVSESDARKAVIKKVEPEYPAMARQIRLSGQVQVDVVIAETGAVEKVNVIKGNVLLSNSAVAALKKWKFTPFAGTANRPSKAIASLTFDFRLGSGAL